jgi:AAA domain
MGAVMNVTFFKDRSAFTLERRAMTLEELRGLVLKTTAETKKKTPLLKLAVFGDERTKKKCLRSNKNTIAISGAEGDCDTETMAFGDAVARMKDARITALVYTSPSHTPEKPRWRVLVPTSKELPKTDRVKLVARLNGILGGVLAGESFTLSQPHHYGSVNDNPDHRAIIVEGDYIDLRSDLDAGALGKREKPKGNGQAARGLSDDPHDTMTPDEELIADIKSGQVYHQSLLALAARHIGRGSTAKEAVAFLQGLMNESVGERDERWHDRVASIPGLVDSAVEKYGEWAKDETRGETPNDKAEAPKSRVLSLQWHGDAPWQPPKWMIRNRLPETGDGLLVGQWGMLKTFMALDLSAHLMLGWDWTGEPVYRQSGVLCLAQEGGGSIPMRLAALVEHKIKKTDRLPFTWASRCPMLLGVGKEDPLPLLLATAELAHERFLKEFGLPLGLIWIDTMSSAGGWSDENNNAEAAQLMNVLRGLSEMSGAVVVGVDHLGKNVDAGSRGASAKEANSDFVLALLGNKSLAGDISDMRLALRKVREGPSGLEFPVAPKVVDMGQDEQGYPLTSIVLDWNVKRVSKEKKSNAHQVLDHALAVALKEYGKMVKPADSHEVRAVGRMHVLTTYKAAYKPDQDVGDGAKRQAFRQALGQAAGRSKSETIDGVEYLWRGDAPF